LNTPNSPVGSWSARLQAQLMPDYNRRARRAWWALVVAGSLSLVWSLVWLLQQPWTVARDVALAILLAVAAGLFPVRVPGTKSSYVASEISVFFILLLHGPAAAVVVAAGEAFTGSWRSSKRWSSRLFSPASAALAMAAAGWFLQLAMPAWPPMPTPTPMLTLTPSLTPPLIAAPSATVVLAFSIGSAALYFVATVVFVSGVVRVKRGESFVNLREQLGQFRWVGLAHAGSAAMAALLYLAQQDGGWGVLLVMLPVLALLLLTLHLYFRQQEARLATGAAAASRGSDGLDSPTQPEPIAGDLRHMASHDALTDLPNRRHFIAHLRKAVARSAGDGKHVWALMVLDFDRFKTINDTLGHAAGDDLLVQMARRLQARLRPGDMLARFGGDEFVVLAERITAEAEAVVLAERLMDALAQPFTLGPHTVQASASIGMTFSAFGYTLADDALRDADVAMYKAKADGRGRYALFDTRLQDVVAERLRLQDELRRAVAQGELSVVYQPLFALGAPGSVPRLDGFEALVRWQHPRQGLLSPHAFLAMAEDSGQMLQLTDFVLHCACRQLAQWQARDVDRAGLNVSVNLSAADLQAPALAARVGRALVEAGVWPARLTLEVNETVLMANVDTALPNLTAVRGLGVQVFVDDFGRGHSSLSHLTRLPMDGLKIDSAFIHLLERRSADAAVVAAMLQLGQSLHKRVVAEGIETAGQLAQLRQLGCAFGQGFLLSPPMPAKQVQEWLMQRRGG